jgi:WD40 repeat protein
MSALRSRWLRSRRLIIVSMLAAITFLTTAALLYWSLPVRPQLVLETRGPKCWIVGYSRDGQWIAGTSYREDEHFDHRDAVVHVWHTGTGREMAKFALGAQEDQAWFAGPPFSPDGRHLVVTFGPLNEIHTVQLVEVTSGTAKPPLKGRDFRFTPEGKALAMIVQEKETNTTSLAVIDPDTGRELVRRLGVSKYCLAPDGRLLAVIGNDERTKRIYLKILETATGRDLALLADAPQKSDGSITFDELAFLPDGRTFIYRDFRTDDYPFVFWDLLTQSVRWKLPGCWDYAGCTPDGKTIATWPREYPKQQIKLWDVENGRSTGELLIPESNLWRAGIELFFSPDNTTLTAACTGQIVGHSGQPPRYEPWDAGFTWNLRSRELIASYTNCLPPAGNNFGYVIADKERAWDGYYAPENPPQFPWHIVRIRENGADSVLELVTGKECFKLPTDKDDWDGYARSWYEFSPDSKLFAVNVCESRKPKAMWDWLESKWPTAFAALDKPIERIRCWDSATGKEYPSLPGGGFESVFSPDSRQLAVPSENGTIKLWDLPPRKPLGLILAWSCVPAGLVLLFAWWRGRQRSRVAATSTI